MEDAQQLKRELLEKISMIEDYDILQALREDIQLYEIQHKVNDPYEFPGATEEEREELIKIDKSEIPASEDCVTHEEFKQTMSRWLRSNL